MNISSNRHGSVDVVKLPRRLVMANAPEVRKQLLDMIAADHRHLVLDLGEGYGRHVLSRQPAASGAKYGDDRYVFWTKGDEAMVDAFGEPFLSGCRTQE